MSSIEDEGVQSSVKGIYPEEKEARKELKSEETLQRGEEKFRNIFESANDCMIYLDSSGRILDVNSKALEVFGGSKKELLGKHFTKVGVLSLRELPTVVSNFAEALAGKKTSITVCIRNKKGQEIPLECAGSVTKIDDKFAILIIARDITERKRAEDVLRKSENKFRTLLENLPQKIFFKDRNSVYISCNGNYSRDLKIKSDEIVGRTDYDFYPEKLAEKYRADDKRVMESGKTEDIEEEYIQDGQKIYVHTVKTPVKDENGDVVGILGIFWDVTERKKAEETLRESEQKYRNLFENARDVILTFDLKGNVTSVNKAAVEYGFKEEIIGKNMLKFVSKKYWPRLLMDLAKIAQGNSPKGEIEIMTSKGKRFVEYSSVPIRFGGKIVGLQAILRDVSERMQTLEALGESEERLKQLIEYAPDAIYINDLKGNFIDGNKQAEKLTGYNKEELIGKSMLKIGLLPKKCVPNAAKALMKNLLGQKTGPDEFELIRKDGRRVTVEISTFPVRRGGKVEVIGIARDVTERKEMEEKLKQYSEHLEELVKKRTEELLESEKRYSVLVEEASDAVAILQDEKIVFTNKKGAEIVGYSKDELIGLPFRKLVSEEHQKLTKERYEQRLRGKIVPSTYEIGLIAETGERVPVELSATRIHHQGRPADLIILRDIRERKRMEQEHLKLGKLAAIGELATMVGHDLRNPLTGMLGAEYYLKKRYGSKMDNKAKEMLEIIEKNVEYSNKIINDLLEYSREIKLELTESNPKKVIKEALSLVDIPTNVQVIDLTEKQPKISVDAGKMKRAIVNIVKNAIEAMPEGGTLTIRSRKLNGDLEIAFTDTGVGMPKDITEKIFTPLFTTKAKGMGFGLPICKRFIEAHGGKISVESAVGKGATFTIIIPTKPKLEIDEKIWVNTQESLLSTTTKA
jgi:PAS domain S-box-containing protein